MAPIAYEPFSLTAVRSEGGQRPRAGSGARDLVGQPASLGRFLQRLATSRAAAVALAATGLLAVAAGVIHVAGIRGAGRANGLRGAEPGSNTLELVGGPTGPGPAPQSLGAVGRSDQEDSSRPCEAAAELDNWEGVTSWQVINNKFTNVRSGKHLFSRVIGMKAKCVVIKGKQEGNWLKLAHEPGYMLISGDDGSKLLRESSVDYHMISSGTCGQYGFHPVNDLNSCEGAAMALGFQDVRANVLLDPGFPEGCYVLGGSLWLSTSPANKGRGADGARQPLCSTSARPPLERACTAGSKPREAARLRNASSALSLFCFSIVRPFGYEAQLLMAQFENQASIFRCNYYKVLTVGTRLRLGAGWLTTQVGPNATLAPVPPALVDQRPTLDESLEAWDLILQDESLLQSDWVVKVEPDAIFFPSRLKKRLVRHNAPVGKDLFFLSCDRFKGPPTLLGSVEVFSLQAIKAYAWGKDRCKQNLPWQTWGESQFMQQCLQLLHVTSALDASMIGDSECWASPCTDATKVAFHAFTNASSYLQCWEEANEVELAMEWPMDTVSA